MIREIRLPIGASVRLWPDGSYTVPNPDGSSTYVCDAVVAVEDAFARASVFDFAANEYIEAREAADELRRRRHEGIDRMHGVDHRPLKPVAPFSVFLEQSRALRIKRERDATCYNDSTRHEPGRRRADL